MGDNAGSTGPSPGRPRVGLVLNPLGRRADRARRELAAALAAAGAPAPTVLTTTVESPGAEQTRRLLAAGVDLVVVAGGDGTVREAARVLAGTDVALGILPTGTANIVARNLRLPRRDVRLATAIALGAGELRMDLGRARMTIAAGGVVESVFLVMAGIGRDAQTVAATGARLKRCLGWLAYFAAGIRHAVLRPLPMVVELDGHPRRARTWTVLFGNLPRIPGGIAVFPDAVPDDGVLETLEVPLRGPLDWAAVACTGLFHRPRRTRALAYGRASAARVTPPGPLPVQLDGDVVADVVDLEVGLLPSALTVRCPPHRPRSGDPNRTTLSG
ncbi:diacylglycerol/lipid kinase family protein [Raineyella sp. LH-20]|uniref:diacylglycerol/lipid kinase family protein n=1 Tax=Raineyella sp. LH-20 TaxID=3081204 RepID=UPI0029548618|nr:diacylglycerol kinase family protein [Raineyella sp. LH-20]WOP17521.1 diacylglycerol kinase family protein [Raineyella sp. LH-20]